MKFNLKNPVTYIVGIVILYFLFHMFIKEEQKLPQVYKNKKIDKLKEEDKKIDKQQEKAAKVLDSLNKKIFNFKILVNNAKAKKDTINIITQQDSLINVLDKRIVAGDTLNNLFKKGDVVKDSVINLQSKDLDSLNNELNLEKMNTEELKKIAKKRRNTIIAIAATEISVVLIYLLLK
jgi:hypothetical protein